MICWLSCWAGEVDRVVAPVETNAHLLRYDSMHGRFPGEVTVRGDTISYGNGAIKVTAMKDPA